MERSLGENITSRRRCEVRDYTCPYKNTLPGSASSPGPGPEPEPGPEPRRESRTKVMI